MIALNRRHGSVELGKSQRQLGRCPGLDALQVGWHIVEYPAMPDAVAEEAAQPLLPLAPGGGRCACPRFAAVLKAEQINPPQFDVTHLAFTPTCKVRQFVAVLLQPVLRYVLLPLVFEKGSHRLAHCLNVGRAGVERRTTGVVSWGGICLLLRGVLIFDLAGLLYG